MTQYESLSLSLLITIANGISLQLTQPPESDEARQRRHAELVRAFRKGTEEMVDVIASAIRGDAQPEPPSDEGS